MSIDHSGFSGKVLGQQLSVTIDSSHPLIHLANTLPWSELQELILPDIKASTPKGKWWMGRPLRLRIHLGIYVLQKIFNKTDRQIEYDVRDNAAYQLFCGKGLVQKWHAPDHTKIEEFRSRLSSETQQTLANYVALTATRLGFADPLAYDIDSTVQEANMAYPSDASLLTKLGVKAKNLWHYMQEKFSCFTFEEIDVDLKIIKRHARACFFSKTKDKKEKNDLLSDLWQSVFSQVMPIIKRLEVLTDKDWHNMPWNLRHIAQQLKDLARDYCIDVCKFLNTGKMEANKCLAFHVKEAACFNKGKPNKKYQFGRAFQIGRLGGNFLTVAKCNDVRMDDKKSLTTMLDMHANLFGEATTKRTQVATDKGYYSKKNSILLKQKTLHDTGLQKPGTSVDDDSQNDNQIALVNRRSGIEPLIGHAKQNGQLGRSRMKSDKSTEAAGYGAIFGFNARQLMRYLVGNAAPSG